TINNIGLIVKKNATSNKPHINTANITIGIKIIINDKIPIPREAIIALTIFLVLGLYSADTIAFFAIICLPICFGDSKAPMIWYSFFPLFSCSKKYCSYSYITLSRSFRGRFSNSCSSAFKNVILSKLSTAIQIVGFNQFLFQFKNGKPLRSVITKFSYYKFQCSIFHHFYVQKILIYFIIQM